MEAKHGGVFAEEEQRAGQGGPLFGFDDGEQRAEDDSIVQGDAQASVGDAGSGQAEFADGRKNLTFEGGLAGIVEQQGVEFFLPFRGKLRANG